VLRAQLELGQVRQEIDRRIAEKEEEFNNSRFIVLIKNYLQIKMYFSWIKFKGILQEITIV
jgi:hypothetical protein